MEVTVQKWGNSAAIRLPATVLKQMRIDVGNVLSLDFTNETMTLKPAKAKPHYKLSDLMALCDLNASEPAELAAWNAIKPVGRES
ncbi:AbrB/MazE/SpoVT family DNA-binding domain-containing protein [Stutzerimonas stutzeri]|uniref:AbrB/MazE/SpoVT family DNA-binding domain-containing protein n=1 Tax=Stutzerimonas stutzeri TaxID=316 RepID=UPI00265D4210|nr:AbrB/MazE/SpoVT family DNA-binding domain-containing protein [Stutzerimonas stutzeri]MCF6783708.1 AbrB/MazE/SpoVT family DNA-binding domain-containing protein [Stutzerimonas stutzeri]